MNLINKVAPWLVVFIPFGMMVAPAGIEVPASLISLMFLYRSFRLKDWSWLNIRWVQIIFAFWIYMMVRGLFAEHPDDAVSRAAAFIRYPIFGIALMHWVLKDGTTQYRLLISILAATTFYVADSIFQQFYGHDIFGYEKMPYGTEGRMRLTGPFGEKRVGIIITWLIFPALLFVCGLKGKKNLLVSIGLLVAFLLAVFASGERMAFLLAIMGIIIAFLFVRKVRLPIFISGVCGIAAFFMLSSTHPEIGLRQINDSKKEITGYSQSAYGMLVMSAIEITKQNPLFGVGNKHFRSACPDARYGATDKDTLHYRCSLHPHNIWAELLSETGLVGTLLFLSAVFWWVREVFWHYRQTISDPVLAGITIGIIIKLWPIAATTSFFVGWSAIPLWLFIGWMLARQNLPSRHAL